MNKLEAWSELLDQVKSELGISSDAELARRIDVTRSYISAIRVGRKMVSFELADKLFILLGMNLREHVNFMFLPEDMTKDTEYSPLLLAKREEVLARANEHCDLCHSKAPFTLRDGTPYLEFTIFSIDTEKHEAALCPNCHKKLKILDSESDKQSLLENIISKNS